MISICIIEDIIEIQQGLQDIISRDQRFKLLGCFETAESAIVALPELQPDVVLTDINLPQQSGIDCIEQVKVKCPDMQFMMFTIYEDNDQVFEALKAGATGYILKNTAPDKIIEALLELQAGGSPMSPKIARKVLTTFTSKKMITDLISKREQEVLELLSKGYLYKEIADQLHITLSTVKRHLNHIYQKLQVQNTTEAINKMYGR
jgi:DNA-binding NarL/FixJ family response regulator